MIDRNKAKQIQEDVLAALSEVAEKHGVSFNYKGGTFTSNNFTMKLEAAVVNTDGTVSSRDADSFKALATMYGLKPEWLNQTFTSGGLEFTITGLNPRKQKNVVIAKQTRNGKSYVFPAETVARAFALKGA